MFPDRFSRLASPVHRLPAWLKASVALGLLLAIGVTPVDQACWLVIPAVLLVTIAIVSRIPVLFVLRRILLLEPFAIGVSLLALFRPNGTVLFCVLVCRATLCLLIAVLLANTTPFADLVRLMRRLRLPSLFVTTIALAYRYLFLCIDEAERMGRARAARTFIPARRHWWRVKTSIAAMLFIRATERAERVFDAMCARGWRP